MLIHAESSGLLLIDMQEKLLPLVIDSLQIEAHCRWLSQIAQYLQIPIVTTEQYPKGLGHTVEGLREFSKSEHCLEKISFSALADSKISHELRDLKRDQWILIGIETHVCVMQTAFELLAQRKKVYVVEDCTGSRHAQDKKLALDRMKHHGVEIVSREMVVFEWLGKAGGPQFKFINENFIK
jgi:nicotinamidase-related amidase